MNSEDINEARRGLGWSIALGIFMIVLGIGAIAEPFVATIAITFVLSWILLIAGIIRIVHAFQSRRKRSFWSKLLIGILYVIAGILLLSNIFGAALSLTLALGILFFVEGVFEVIAAFQVRPDPNWGWVLFSGIMAIILGILIMSEWPFSAAWVLGVFAGINFLLTGIWMIMLSLSIRSLSNQRTRI
ncbi:HdeD family acid-resistance protein [Nostoc sp. MG11]|uniref:HdeD family acid-resistance protein n=1 Tax=Nostoc sp. MG11 TaxID=2721166 RepID=UPI001868AE3E|nr:HdeD family acid-resistance protein [Nostoc sp. MG11]